VTAIRGRYQGRDQQIRSSSPLTRMRFPTRAGCAHARPLGSTGYLAIRSKPVAVGLAKISFPSDVSMANRSSTTRLAAFLANRPSPSQRSHPCWRPGRTSALISCETARKPCRRATQAYSCAATLPCSPRFSPQSQLHCRLRKYDFSVVRPVGCPSY